MIVANSGAETVSLSATEEFDLEREIASSEAKFKQLENAIALLKASKNAKNPNKIHEIKQLEVDKSFCERLISNLQLCRSFLPGTSVEANLGREEVAKGVVEGIFIDHRGTPMLRCEFGKESHHVSPRNLKAPGIDFSTYPDKNEIEARTIRNEILKIECQRDHLNLCGKFTSEKLNWVRLKMISLEDRNRIRSLIEDNPIPRPVKVGDYVGDRLGGQIGLVSSVTLNGLTIDGRPEVISWAEFEENQYQKLKTLESASGKLEDFVQIEDEELESASGKLGEFVQIEDRDEQYTPNTSEQPVLNLVAKALGGQIDVDLMANDMKTMPARFHITKSQDYFTFDLCTLGEGLKGFMNPPFSDPLTPLKKLCSDFDVGHLSEAIVLLKAGTAHNQGTGKLIEQYASAQCQWGVHVGRIGFIKQGVQRKGADFDCSLYYFGGNPNRFKSVFKKWGLVSSLLPSKTIPGKLEDFVQIAGINIKEICRDSGTQQRCKLDLAHTEKLKTLIEEGIELDDLQVMFDGTSYWLWDGFHRLQAYKELEYEDVVCAVTPGTRRDAVLKSVSANIDHPTVLSLTREDKRRSIQTLLTDPEWKDWSNREVARLCGASHVTVAAVRKSLSGQLEDFAPVESAPNNITCVRNGKIMQMSRRSPAETKPLIPLPFEVGEPIQLVHTKNFEGNQVDRGFDGIWGIITHAGAVSCQVYLHLHKKEIQCFPQQMTKLDKDKQVQIKSVGDRIKLLLEDFDVAQHSGASGLLEGLLRTDTFSTVDLMLLESLEKVKDVGDRD